MNAAQSLLRTVLSDPARIRPSSSLEFYQRSAPPPTSLPYVLSQKCSSLRLPIPFDRPIPSSQSVPSSPFLTTSTVYSVQSFAGLLHPATSHGVRPVSSSSFPTQATDRSQPAPQPVQDSHRSDPLDLAESLSTFPVPGPKTLHRSRRSSGERTRSLPSGASTLRSVPLKLSRTRVTISRCVATPLNATTWPTPLVVVRCVLLPRSATTVAGSDFPWRPGHLTQPQGFEPSPSPLHQQAVSDLPMPVAPLGFSGTGSPVP